MLEHKYKISIFQLFILKFHLNNQVRR